MIDILRNISPIEFDKFYVSLNKPLFLEKYTNKLSKIWDKEYLISKSCDKLVNLQIMKLDKNGFLKTSFKKMPFKDAIDSVSSRKRDLRAKYYISGDTIKGNLTELKTEIPEPDFLQNIKIYDYGFWYGEAGNVTPLHMDCFQGILHQIKGKKLIKLYPPQENQYLYLPYENKKESWFRISKAFRILDQETYKIFPNLKNAKYIEVELNPGDMLYIPCGWWHYVYSITESISVNYIWRPYFKDINLDSLLTRTAYLLINKNNFSEIFDNIIFPPVLEEIILHLNKFPSQKWLIPFFIRDKIQNLLINLHIDYNINIPNRYNIRNMLKNLLQYLPKLEEDFSYFDMLQKFTTRSDHLNKSFDDSEIIAYFINNFKFLKLFSYDS